MEITDFFHGLEMINGFERDSREAVPSFFVSAVNRNRFREQFMNCSRTTCELFVNDLFFTLKF